MRCNLEFETCVAKFPNYPNTITLVNSAVVANLLIVLYFCVGDNIPSKNESIVRIPGGEIAPVELFYAFYKIL